MTLDQPRVTDAGKKRLPSHRTERVQRTGLPDLIDRTRPRGVACLLHITSFTVISGFGSLIPLTIHRCVVLMATGLLLIGTLRAAGAGEPLPEQIDRIIEAACQVDDTRLAGASDDAEFLRRAFLDLVGVVPTPAEARAFLQDPAGDKRTVLIDRLLARPEFAFRMACVFDAMLIERRIATIPSYDIKPPEWRDWLIESFRQNKPWDQLVREMLDSDGSDEKHGPAAKFYLVRDVEPHLIARDVGRLLLGTDLQCAQCHNHPRVKSFEQADYFGLYAFVSRLQHFHDGDQKRNYVTEKPRGDVSFTSAFTGTEGQTQPRLPDGEMIADPPLAKGQEYKVKPANGQRGVPAYSRRARLAEFLPRRETSGFSRNIANRMWAVMFGRGIVHPLDMHHRDNPPSHPHLLNLLADRLEATNYDMRGLIRDLALTRTYQRSSRLPEVAPDSPASSRFAVAALRPLSPEQLGWSVQQVTGRLSSRLVRAEHRMKQATLKEEAEVSAQSDAGADGNAKSPGDSGVGDLAWQVRRKVYGDLRSELQTLLTQFSRLPGQPDEGFQPSVDQALFLLNSEQMVKFMNESVLVDRLSDLENPIELADEIFLAVLSRFPTAEERADVAELVDGISERQARREAVRRMVWGQLLSAEFRLNH
ncbi:MAG: DUF1549 and DUF1553 domain-containing protein [Pirellulales bacterium]|nr:DUF1549 and DUF1553 domain-containing protein [Pirellulales bacterium]